MYEYRLHARYAAVGEYGTAQNKEELDECIRRFKFEFAGDEITVDVTEIEDNEK